MAKQRASDPGLEQRIREAERFWAREVPEKYAGWSWIKVPDRVYEEVDSYHRLARLTLQAPEIDWQAEGATLGVPEAVDAHSHLEGYCWSPKLVEELERVLDRAGIRYIVNLSLGLTGDDYLREMEEGWLRTSLADRVLLFPTLDWKIDDPDFVERSAKFLARTRQLGARGVKVHKNVGTSVMTHGRVAPLNDTRFQEAFAAAGELGMPIWIHYGDPYDFFLPLEGNERSREINSFPDWHLHPKGFREKDYWKLHEDFFRLIEAVPGTTFTAVHLANYPWDRIDEFVKLLLATPNLYSDISGRMAEIGRGRGLDGNQRRAAKAREVLTRCQDKVMWGTDMLPTAGLYDLWALFLRSERRDLDYTWATFYPGQGDWLVDGLGLDDTVMRKLCRDNARRLLGL